MDKDSFGIGLLESGELLKRTYTALIANIGKTTAVITLIVSALVIFTDIGFYDIGTAAVTSGTVLLLVASYLMYFSLEESGERLGEQSEEFKETASAYRSAVEKIRPEDIDALRRFCTHYSECELDFRKRSRIMAEGLSFEDYEKYKSGGELSGASLKKLKKIHKMKPILLTPKALLERERISGKSELSNPERGKTLRLILKLIPTTICTIFTATVMLSAKEGLDAVAVIEGLMKLSALPIIGFKGYAQGYNYARGARRCWIETKVRLLEAFIKEH